MGIRGFATSSSTGMASYTRAFTHMSTFSSRPLWVIDSGVVDHMTGMCSVFKSCRPSSRGVIPVANGMTH